MKKAGHKNDLPGVVRDKKSIWAERLQYLRESAVMAPKAESKKVDCNLGPEKNCYLGYTSW
jgi:hypothetical protein